MAKTPDNLTHIARALQETGAPSSDFDLNPAVVLAPDRHLRPAGVLIPIIETERGLQVILTKRSSALKHHPGQIAFPGGKVDPSDSGSIAAALREADEEIGLSPQNVTVLGTLPIHETVTNFNVTPVVGHVLNAFQANPEPGEVQEVFTAPLDHVTDRSNYMIQSRIWRGMKRQFYVVPYGPYYIWGATARMLLGLTQRLDP